MKRVLVGILALSLVVVVVDFVAGPFFAFSTRHWPPERHGNRMVGVIEAVMKRVDPATGIIHVASGVLGLETLRIVIGPDTTVTVGEKLGGLPDLERAYFVRVAYEAQPSRLVAWRVDLIDRGTHASDAAVHRLMAEVGRPTTAAALAAPDSKPAPRGVTSSAPPASSKIRTHAARRPPASRSPEVAATKPRPPAEATSAKAPPARPRSPAVAAAPPAKSASPSRPANPPPPQPAAQDVGVTSQLDLPFPAGPSPRADDASGAAAVSVNMPATPSWPPAAASVPSTTVPKAQATAQTARPTRPSQLP